MNELKGADRRYLRKLAHGLQPCVQIGKAGLTPNVLAQVEQNLLAHELIKVRFIDHKDEKKALSAELAAATRSELAGTVGHLAILYRPHPHPEKRRIRLPRRGVGSPSSPDGIANPTSPASPSYSTSPSSSATPAKPADPASPSSPDNPG